MLPALLAPTPPRADDPLKGLVPYQGQATGFPCSMEFQYVALSALWPERGRFDWRPLEVLLRDVASRGRQFVFRVTLEYPGATDHLPRWWRDQGLIVTEWRDDQPNVTPDYDDPRMAGWLGEFVAALGKRYDGDPRLAAVTMGLLGKWGEWHDFPRDDLFAKKPLQRAVMDAYARAFRRTPVLMRYPAGPNHPTYARNDDAPFGYHDDSFAFGTLPTGKKDEEWFFGSLVNAAGAGARSKWRTRPIGGEIRPEVWGRIFDRVPGVTGAQDFDACVRATHASWVMDSGMFDPGKPPSAERRRRALAAVGRMGYVYRIRSVDVRGRSLRVRVGNDGVAPFYAPWPARFGVLDDGGRLVATFPARGRTEGILPGASRVWTGVAPAGVRGRLVLNVPNPLPNGRPLRFANAGQDRDREGWMTLGRL